MAIEVSRESHKPMLEDGETYESVIAQVQEKNDIETSYGMRDQIWITYRIKSDRGESVELTRRYTRSLNKKSNLYAVINALDPTHFDGMYYDVEKLEGMPCRVLVKHTTNEETGDMWDNVADVLKPKSKATTIDDLANDRTLLD